MTPNIQGAIFSDWYKDLQKLMNAKQGCDGLPLDPDDWCEINVWESHHKEGLTPEQAYLEEC